MAVLGWGSLPAEEASSVRPPSTSWPRLETMSRSNRRCGFFILGVFVLRFLHRIPYIDFLSFVITAFLFLPLKVVLPTSNTTNTLEVVTSTLSVSALKLPQPHVTGALELIKVPVRIVWH